MIDEHTLMQTMSDLNFSAPMRIVNCHTKGDVVELYDLSKDIKALDANLAESPPASALPLTNRKPIGEETR